MNMTETTKLEALRLADRLERDPNVNRPAISAELRRQHAEIERLKKDVSDVAHAVRWAPSSAYWSKELIRICGPEARDGISNAEANHRAEIERLTAERDDAEHDDALMCEIVEQQRSEIERLTAEMQEQCRIIGMSGEREMALRATIEEQRRTIQALMVGMPDDGTTPVIRRIAALEQERDDALNAPWPEWASVCLAKIRAESGYDGYDDPDVGVDITEELHELIGEFHRVTAERDALRARIADAEGQVEKAPGMAVQCLAHEIVESLRADENGSKYDLTAGMFGPAFSKLVRRRAALEYAAPKQAEGGA